MQKFLECIRDLISYEGNTDAQVVRSFHEAVDDYVGTCKEKLQAGAPKKAERRLEYLQQIFQMLERSDKSYDEILKKSEP